MAHASSVDHARAVVRELFGESDARPFDVAFWDGTTDRGTGTAGYALRITRPGALRRMLLPPSELSIVEAYLSGDIAVDGDLERAVTLGDAINARFKSPRVLARVAAHLLALPKQDGPDDVRSVRADRTVQKTGSRHDKKRDRKAIQYHYDVGNDFYRLWLDKRMVYSCAYFATPQTTLEDAQRAKLDHVCRKLRLKPDERLLDVGCGWGALIMHAAECYGVNAIGITLSEAQAGLARERIASAGLADRCRVELVDYRDVRTLGMFDKMASVGMIEHVGVDKLPTYFSVLYEVLAPGGLFLNHGIVSVEDARPMGWRERIEGRLWRRDQFIDQYVFPDGKLGPLQAVIAAAEAAGFETRDAESLREHYAMTLREWVRRLRAHRVQAVDLAGERVYRTWELYMTASAHGFAIGRLNVVQTLLAKPDASGRSNVPLTRGDLY